MWPPSVITLVHRARGDPLSGRVRQSEMGRYGQSGSDARATRGPKKYEWVHGRWPPTGAVWGDEWKTRSWNTGWAPPQSPKQRRRPAKWKRRKMSDPLWPISHHVLGRDDWPDGLHTISHDGTVAQIEQLRERGVITPLGCFENIPKTDPLQCGPRGSECRVLARAF
jgi:hypothetical protein